MAYTHTTMELPLGQGGLVSPTVSGQITPDTLLQALNVSFADGSLRREGGASLYTAAPVAYPLINAGFDFWPDSSTPWYRCHP